MKTTNFRLLATMFTLAAVITITYPGNAQRRTTETRNNSKRVESGESNRKASVQNKNATRNFESRPNNKSPQKINNSYDVKRYNSNPGNNRSTNSKKLAVTRDENRSSRSYQPSYSNKTSNNQERNRTNYSQSTKKPATQSISERERTSASSSRIIRSETENNTTVNSRRDESRSISKGFDSPNNRSNNDRINVDENDKRYTPNKNYRGSSKSWTENYRPSNMNYNHTNRDFYRNYDYRKYHHWDKRWENYRWNAGSWRDYYRGYNPYSFKYNKYYYHHHRYGHVLRKFVYPPVVYINNHHHYYCYDGHFFRYKRGIGYVLVNVPYGFSFDYLPMDFERVYINGYLYFRVGNLFFEYSDYGYRLIHYPERYFSVHVDFAFNNYW